LTKGIDKEDLEEFVLAIVEGCPHLYTEDIWRQVQRLLPEVSFLGVNVILERLKRKGLVEEFADMMHETCWRPTGEEENGLYSN